MEHPHSATAIGQLRWSSVEFGQPGAFHAGRWEVDSKLGSAGHFQSKCVSKSSSELSILLLVISVEWLTYSIREPEFKKMKRIPGQSGVLVADN